MSGLPFNPMRKIPPPPPHIDTVSFNATEYVMLLSRDNQQMFVHRECLRESPFLRRVFAKGQNVLLDDLVVTFASQGGSRTQDEQGEGSGFASSGHDMSFSTANDVENESAADGLVNAESPTAEKGGARSRSLPFAATSDNGGTTSLEAPGSDETPLSAAMASHKTKAPPLVLTETLQLDQSVTIEFPTTNGATLENIVSYLYYKHRYERKPLEARPPFTVPVGSSITVMKLASLLEC